MTMYKFEEKISNFEVCLTTDYNDWHILPTELIDDIASEGNGVKSTFDPCC